MVVKKVQARFYVAVNGTMPVRDWILSLAVSDRQRIGRDIQKVEFGWPIGMPYCRPLGRGLWEVRSDLESNRIARVLFCFAGAAIVLLNGFIKKGRKTPDSEMNLALRRMKDLE